MNIKSLTNIELTTQLKSLAKSERKITYEILLHINEVESRRLFAQLGHGSTLDYLVKECLYSESSAYRRIQAARLLKAVPAISTKIEEGKINLSQLSKVQTLIKQQEKLSHSKVSFETKTELLQKIENQNSFQTEKLIAKELNIIIQDRDVVKVQQDDSIYVSLKLSKEQSEKLDEVKSLMSHVNPNPKLSEVFEYLADFYVAKKKGLKKSLTQTHQLSEKVSRDVNLNEIAARKSESEKHRKYKRILRNPITGHIEIKNKINTEQKRSGVCLNANVENGANNSVRLNNSGAKYSSKLSANKTNHAIRSLPSSVKNAVKHFANYQCEYIDDKTGQKCLSKHQIEVDHKIPKAKGGHDGMTNLRALCKQHNLLSAQQWFS